MNGMSWHDQAWDIAVSAAAPSLLLHGPAGIGERAFAVALAEAWLCEKPDRNSRQPCTICPSCRLLAAGNHPDLRIIEPEAIAVSAASTAGSADGDDEDEAVADDKPRSDRKLSQEIRVVQLRQLVELAHLSSHRGGARVVIIHPVDAMNLAASNALLKLLEEPPDGMRFVLVAHRLRRVSATVLSRCMRVALTVPAPELAIEWLIGQGVQDATQALALAGGSPQVALANADPLRATIYRAWLQCVSEPSASAVAAARDTKDAGPAQVLAWLLQWTHDLALVKAGARPRYHPQQAAVLQRHSAALEMMAIARLHRTLLLKQRWIRHPLNPQLSLEALWHDYLQHSEIR